MKADDFLGLFFQPGTQVLALPGWRHPRLFLPARQPLRRWEQSSIYPASRPGARLYRLSLRLGAVAGLAGKRTVRPAAPSGGWPLGEFVREVLPKFDSAVVLMGTPGPAQGITAQLRDEKGQVLGYLKYAEKEAALKRVRHERFVLSNLPKGLGPEPVKFGALGSGEALLKSALLGRLLIATLPPLESLTGLLDSFVVSPPVPLEDHPWVCRMRERGMPEPDASWFEPLANRTWPVAIQHGDFVPWNLLRGPGPNGTLRAVDWEYGALEGFPYLDLAYYVLQTSALVYRRAPLEAARYAAEYLAQRPKPALSDAEARALVRLAAYDAFQKSREDGRPPDVGLQAWRREIWESAAFEAPPFRPGVGKLRTRGWLST